MPTSSELAQYRLLMQMQNQANRIPFPTVTPTSGGAGVNFLQGLSGGLGYGMQVRQQRQSVEQLNQMMQAQAAAEQQAAAQQMARTQALYQQLGLNPALAGASEDLQKTYLTQTGQTLNADLQGQRLRPMLMQPSVTEDGQPVYDVNGNLVMVPTADARDIMINTTLGRDPGAIQVPQAIAQAAGVGAAASDQKFGDTLRNLLALSSKLAKDKEGNFTPESLRTLQNAYGQAFGGGAPVTSADLQKEALGVQDAAVTVAGKQLGNTGAALGNTKTAIGNTELNRLQSLEQQFQTVTLPSIRNRVDLTEPEKIQLAASQRTLMGLPEGAPVASFFGAGKVDKTSPLAGFTATAEEAKTQAMDAAKPKPLQLAPSRFQQDIGNVFKSLEAGTNFMTPQQYDQAKGRGPLQGLQNYFFNPVAQPAMQRPQQPSFMLGR
jgi:hypothetical protein